MVTISITSQQNVCEEKKVIEQFQLFIFGTEVLISLISSLGGWWGCGWVVFLAKGSTSHALVFLISDKKGTSKLTQMAVLRKKGTLRSQWQSLINSPFCEKVMICMEPSFSSETALEHGYLVRNIQLNSIMNKKPITACSQLGLTDESTDH